MSDEIAFDALRAADPAESAPAFDPTSARGQALLARAKTMPAPDAAPVKRRRGPRLVAVAAVGLAALAAAAAYVNSREPDRVLLAGCYAAPSTHTKVVSISTQKKTAIDECWRMWRAGQFSPTPTPARLIACVLEDGSLGVFPGGPESCARVRADRAPDDVRAAPELVKLSDNIAAAWLGQKCVPPDRARQLARKALDDAGLPDWPVVGPLSEPFNEAKPCATLIIDEAEDRLVLVPSVRPSEN